MAQRRQCPWYVDDARPFAQRTDGMSLDIIHPKDVPRGKVPFIKDEDRSLKTQDIDRAAPHYRHMNYLEKPDYSVGCTDPDHHGGRARSYYAPMDRRPRDLSLTTADIELAQTKASKFKGNRHTDPVCPSYELPSTNLRPITPPRWNGRHLHDLSDIEKSGPKVRIPTRNYIRDPNDASDIEFSSANYQERVHRRTRQGKPDITMNVKDINQTKPLHSAPRCTNPLDPEYKVSTTATTSLHTKYTEEMGRRDVKLHAKEAEIHGHIHGSKPRKLQWDNGEPQFSLVREDIAGTVPQRWVGAVPTNIYDPPEVKPVITFHDPHDIPGAQVGTLKKGIEGSRRGGSTNPLNPRYKMLDGDVRPQPVPVYDAERNMPLHSLAQSRAQASSLPNLRPAQAATPVGSVPPSQRNLKRDYSDGALRQRESPAASQRGAPMQQSGRPGSRGGTPTRAAGNCTPARAQQGIRSGPGTPAQQRRPSGPGTPTQGIGASGRGTPAGYTLPPGQYGAPGYTLPPGQNGMPGGDYSPQGNYSYGAPQGMEYYGAPVEAMGQPGGQYYEQYQQPEGSYSMPGPRSGTGPYVPPVQLPPGDYGDGYIPEGYVP